MTGRIFMSVPDGPYWAKKEAEERARTRTRRRVVDPVRGASPRRTQQGKRGPDNER
jgi:hypothetical protein